MSEARALGEIIAEQIMKQAEDLSDGPMNRQATKIEGFLEVLALEEEASGKVALRMSWMLAELPDKLRKWRWYDLVKKAELVLEDLHKRATSDA